MKRAIERLPKIFITFVVITFLMSSLTVNAQLSSSDILEDETQQLSQGVDSLVNQWQNTGMDISVMVPDSIPVDSVMLMTALPDSVYLKRLSEIVSPIPFPYNETVKKYIELYTIRKRDQVERMLGLSEYYFPMFEAALDAQNMPLELKYLPIIESALNTRARSRVGASGLWQFMYGTGKMYGLEVNSFVDERLNPQKATEAAVKFLKDLYTIYGDWHLAIAAYNCGPGNVNKAIKRSGGKQNFWQVFYYLPKETRNYVPAFIAAGYVMNYYHDHSLMPRPTLLPQISDTILVSKPVHFEQVATVLSCSVDMLRELNPQYRLDVVPALKKSYPLCLPFEYAIGFASNEDSIFNVNRDKYFTNNEKLLANPTQGDFAPDAPFNSVKICHTVRNGETPGHIAEKYHISLSNLRNWNHLNSRMLIRAGQKLTIYVPKGRETAYVKTETKVQSATDKVTSSSNVASTNDGEYIYYTVKSGDNLWTIAQQFPGVSNTDIMELNNITNSRKLAVGQRLKIKPKS